ncbi:hypothetical protein GW935_00425 [Candidatus Falkowbacteria bacterium]|nr:hypothetical protein [Candidatus Falkowbacteria bacterium]
MSLTVWRLWGNNLHSVNAALPDSTTSAPLRGYVWTDTIGWIRMWNTGKGYGVAVSNCFNDTCDFATDSWAWSDNVGWIAFFNYTGSLNPNCGVGSTWAKFNKATRELSGCAYVLSMGSEGWISLNNDPSYYVYAIDSGEGLPEDWGVYSDPQRGKLSGYAWSGCKFSDNTEKGCGLGWLSFKGVGYVVNGRPDLTIPSTELVKDDESHKIKISWSPAFGANYYQVYRKNRKCVGGSNNGNACTLKKDCVTACVSDGGDPAVWTCQGSSISCSSGDWSNCIGSCNEVSGNATNDFGLISSKTGFQSYTFTDSNNGNGLDVGYTYHYAVNSCNILACVSSDVFSRQTSVLEITSLNLRTVCSDKDAPSEAKVYLTWTYFNADPSNFPVNTGGFDVQRCKADVNGVCLEGWQGRGQTAVEYFTDTLANNDRFIYFKYRVRVYSSTTMCSSNGVTGCTLNQLCDNGNGTCYFTVSSWAESTPVKACADASGYQEVRVE